MAADPDRRPDRRGGAAPLVARREDRRWMLTPALADRLQRLIADQVTGTLCDRVGLLPRAEAHRVAAAVATFHALYPLRPVPDNKGGSLFDSCLWLYVIAQLRGPRLIVESGTYKGQTTWLLRRACPLAEIHSCDPEPQLVHREETVHYHAADWMAPDLGADLAARAPAADFVFFDDHVNQARRVREAYERGFRFLVFDDNFPAYNLYATGTPPVPTLAMLFDDALAPDTEIRWLRHGKTFSYHYREADTHGARALIADYVVLPDLAGLTRYNPQSGLSVVRLVD